MKFAYSGGPDCFGDFVGFVSLSTDLSSYIDYFVGGSKLLSGL